MTFTPYTLTDINEEADQTYILKVQPRGASLLTFKPGQYVYVKNPQSSTPEEEHPFALASSPLQKEYLEFCIKVLGDWTSEIAALKPGDTVFLSEPHGSFGWDDLLTQAVFLVGGVGIAPLMSVLRTLSREKKNPSITMLYGSRTQDTIVYKQELAELQKQLPHFRVIYVLSHLSASDPWTGYRGFFSQEILQKEIDFSAQPVFFASGPPIFIEKMDDLLRGLSVETQNIRHELRDKKGGEK